jgi:hypothetical protein
MGVKKKLSFLLLVIVLNNCGRSETVYDYKYAGALHEYLKQYHDISIDAYSDIYLLVIPIGGCAPCVEESLALAIKQSHNEKLRTILLADSKKDYLKYRNLISQLNQTLTSFERNGKDNDFELGIFSPTILQYQKGKLVYYKELSANTVAEAAAELKWNY